MDANIIDEILDTLLDPIAAAESRSAALLQLLQESGTVSEERLNRALEQAGNAAEIKSHGRRLRLKRILSVVITDIEKADHPEENTKPEKLADKEAAESVEDAKEKSGEEPRSEAEQHPKKPAEAEENAKQPKEKPASKRVDAGASKEAPRKEQPPQENAA
jgi:hypothetical protein